MTEQEYNGWTNRETWATMLHIDNDQGLQEQAHDYARTSWEEHQNDDPNDPEANVSFALYCLADSLENWFDDLAGDFTELPSGVYYMLRDIGSLYRVNWREIAEALLDNIREEVEA